jgi:hypothetical protein
MRPVSIKQIILIILIFFILFGDFFNFKKKIKNLASYFTENIFSKPRKKGD